MYVVTPELSRRFRVEEHSLHVPGVSIDICVHFVVTLQVLMHSSRGASRVLNAAQFVSGEAVYPGACVTETKACFMGLLTGGGCDDHERSFQRSDLEGHSISR